MKCYYFFDYHGLGCLVRFNSKLIMELRIIYRHFAGLYMRAESALYFYINSEFWQVYYGYNHHT